jgi:hypothetical protein
MKGAYQIDQASPGFSVSILLFFPWFRLFDERYLQFKAHIFIERSELNRIRALRIGFICHTTISD